MTERFLRTLRLLGFSTYDDYLNSNLWREFRERYAASGRPSLCRVCGSDRYTLHHVTYERVGCERLEDVIPLCWACHKAVHRYLDNSRLPVEATERAVAFLRERRTRRRGRGRGRGRLPRPRPS